MKTAGIDIASAGKAALALATDGRPRRVFIWQPEHHRDSEAVRLMEFHDWLEAKLTIYRPQVIAVEQLAVFLNEKVIRALSHFEGVALYTCKQRGAIVVNPTIGSSRNIALGLPANSNKEVAWKKIKEIYPRFPFGQSNHGGMDAADAMVHALSATTHLERGKGLRKQ